MPIDQQFFRSCPEATTEFSAQSDESGEFKVIERDRPSGRVKIIAEGLEPRKAQELRNEMIRATDPN